MLTMQHLTLSYSHKNIVEDISLDIPSEKITVLIGANGSGKSTLLKAMSRLLLPKRGSVYLEDKDIATFKSKELAQKLTMLPQNANAPEDLSILDLVRQGRYPYHTLISRWTKTDEEIVELAIQKMGLWDVRERRIANLSGGQKQRAWIALSLAQDTDLVFLDEPTNHLDIKYQIEILQLIQELNELDKKTIVMVLHDINYAIQYSHYIVALKDGHIYKSGNKEDIISEELIKMVYDVKCKLIQLDTGETICVPVGR